MNIWETDKLILFLMFFIPGFVSIKIYDLFIPGEQRDFTKSLFEVIGYSALNYAVFSWLIIWLYFENLYFGHKIWFFILLVMIMLVFPSLWPVLFIRLWSWEPLAKYIIHPIKKPWDYLFGKGELYWMIVHLKDGRKIGGKFDKESFASSFPAEEQLYLEEVWELDQKGKFIEPIDRSAGIIVLSNEISSIELFK
ncbi:MAG: DUF6338 family protein [bacterium]